MRTILAAAIFCTFFSLPTQSQILDKVKKVKDKITENTIDKLSRDPITTSFKDVDKTRYIDDTFGNDETYQSIFSQPFSEAEGFTLQPGFYEGNFQSFCIKAGTYSPLSGRGRFYAPIKGPKADIMSAIIEKYQGDSNITQREVQLLLWAIIAKTDFSKMKGPVKVIALKLLTPTQIARLSKGAIDNLTRSEVRKITNQSPAIRAILEAEYKLRSKYYSGARSYEDFEEIAILAGVEPIVSGWEAGRWTKHPDGYYIRYYPQGYPKTRTQVYVPGSLGTVIFNPANDIAVPADSGQRLLQTNLPYETGGSNTGGYVNDYEDPFCEPAFNAIADKAVRDQMIMQNIPGLAIAIYQNGKMVHLKAYGYQDYYSEEKITLTSRMKWASISKSVTGVAAAQLEERKIKYNGEEYKVAHKVTDYIENWDAVEYTDTTGEKTGTDKRPLDITIANTLTNYSGIQQYGKGSRSGKNERYTLFIKGEDTTVVKFKEDKDAYGGNDTGPRKFKAKEAVDVFNKSVLDTIPGTKYLYSSYGFVLAGATVDKVTPNGYRKWVKDNIINLAGLSSMRVGGQARPGHDMDEDGMLESFDGGINEWTIPAGGYESNICDLAKYAFALSTGKFLEQKKDILWNNPIAMLVDPSDATGAAYSYGLNSKGSGSKLRVYHGGKHSNVRSYMHFFPSDSTGIAILAPAVYANLPGFATYVFQEMGIRSSIYKNKKNTPSDKCRTDMENGEDLFHGVWRKTGKDVLVRTGYEKSGFFRQMDYLKDNGYEVVDIETFKDSGKRYWDAVLRRGSPDTKLVSDLTLTGLKQKINEMKNDGYIVTDIESYIAGNSGRLWGAVFSKQNRKNKATFKMRGQELKAEHQTNAANGFKLVDIESYPSGNVMHWTGVWAAGSDTEVEVNLKPRELFDLLDSKRNQGYRIADLEYYMLNNQEWRVGVVWEKSGWNEFITGEVADIDGDGDDDGNSLTLHVFCDHMLEHHLLSAQGYELIDWERMDVEWFDD